MPKVGNPPRRHFRQRRGRYHRDDRNNVRMEVTDEELVIRIDLTQRGEKTVKTNRGDEELFATTKGWRSIPGHPHMHVSVRACRESEGEDYDED